MTDERPAFDRACARQTDPLDGAIIQVAVADDYEPIRSALRRFFECEPGFRWAGEAADAEEAIRLVMTYHVDVLILDLGMPGSGGLDALPRLRAAAPHLRVVVLSAYPASGYAARAIALGASNYLEKPSDLDLLAATVRRAMTEGPPTVTGNFARRD